jgi:hypothetical protein
MSIDEFAQGKAAGDFHEPLDLQRRSHDPSQDRGRGVVAGIAVAGFSISARNTSDEGFTQTASTRDEGRQAGGDHELRQLGRTLKENSRNSRGSLQPPKVATWILEDPNYPQVDYENARSPRAFSFCGVSS